MKTSVVNKAKENFDIYIGRGSIYGNPYVIGVDGTRDQVINRYREWFNFLLRDPQFVTEVRKLEGKKLGCFCSPQPCHGDIIAEWLNNTFDTDETPTEPEPTPVALPQEPELTEEQIFEREAAEFNAAYAFYEATNTPEAAPEVKPAPKAVDGPDTL
jgi:hypothetical protein